MKLYINSVCELFHCYTLNLILMVLYNCKFNLFGLLVYVMVAASVVGLGWVLACIILCIVLPVKYGQNSYISVTICLTLNIG